MAGMHTVNGYSKTYHPAQKNATGNAMITSTISQMMNQSGFFMLSIYKRGKIVLIFLFAALLSKKLLRKVLQQCFTKRNLYYIFKKFINNRYIICNYFKCPPQTQTNVLSLKKKR